MTILIIVLLVIAAFVTFIFCYTSAYYKRRARLLEKVPVSPVGDIDEKGTTKVVGRVVALDGILQSPLSRSKCVCYRIIIERRADNDDATSGYKRRRAAEGRGDDDADWETVVDDVKSVAFAVEDDTGMATIESKNLELDIKSKRRVDSGYLKALSEAQEKMLNQLFPGKQLSFTKKMRFKEITIEEGDKLAVTGEIDLPRDDHPRFQSRRNEPLHISDESVNWAAAQSLDKAKIHLILTAISGTCMLGLAIWLTVVLASPRKKPSSIETASNSSSDSQAWTPKKIDRDNRLDELVKDNPPFNPPKDNPPFNPPKDDIRPFDPLPKNDDLPAGNDIDSVLARYRFKADKNDVFGSGDELKALALFYKPDLPQRAAICKELFERAKSDNVFIRQAAWKEAIRWAGVSEAATLAALAAAENEHFRLREILTKLDAIAPAGKNHPNRGEICSSLLALTQSIQDPFGRGEAMKAACSWAAKDEVPKLCEVLTAIRDGGAESAILRRLKELADPRSAEAVAGFLLNLGKQREAADVLKAIGPPAEKAVHPYTLEKGPDGMMTHFAHRRVAIDVLGEIGTKASVPLLKQLTSDRVLFVRQSAQAALAKVTGRK